MLFLKGLTSGFLKAAADYRAKQWYFLKAHTTAETAILAGSGQAVIGVLANEPNSGEPCEIIHNGICPVIAGNTVTAGDAVMSDAAGKVIPHTGTNKVAGVALNGGATGAHIMVLLTCGNAFGTSSHYGHWAFPITMASIADGDIVTTFTPGFAGTITKVWWIQQAPVTTAAKLANLNVEIGTTNLTGGVVALTSAACTPLGKCIDGTAVTANNTFTDTDTISVEASSTTTFIEGSGTLFIQYTD